MSDITLPDLELMVEDLVNKDHVLTWATFAMTDRVEHTAICYNVNRKVFVLKRNDVSMTFRKQPEDLVDMFNTLVSGDRVKQQSENGMACGMA